MQQEVYSLAEMAKLGYSKPLLLELIKEDKDREFSWRASPAKTSKWLIHREKFESYLKRVSNH
ncbi:MAG: hypothetical protein E7242_00940 [Lachnospiraceae bacterium]|nr:hypothetical protein [Lachnospiraceae bacterium]